MNYKSFSWKNYFFLHFYHLNNFNCWTWGQFVFSQVPESTLNQTSLLLILRLLAYCVRCHRVSNILCFSQVPEGTLNQTSLLWLHFNFTNFTMNTDASSTVVGVTPIQETYSFTEPTLTQFWTDTADNLTKTRLVQHLILI